MLTDMRLFFGLPRSEYERSRLRLAVQEESILGN